MSQIANDGVLNDPGDEEDEVDKDRAEDEVGKDGKKRRVLTEFWKALEDQDIPLTGQDSYSWSDQGDSEDVIFSIIWNEEST